jgi:branched-chain amino acid transport system substrate-binding protein
MTSRSGNRRARRRAPAVLCLSAVLLSACGTQVSHQRLLEGAGGGRVTTAAIDGAAPGASAQPGSTAPGVPVPGTTTGGSGGLGAGAGGVTGGTGSGSTTSTGTGGSTTTGGTSSSTGSGTGACAGANGAPVVIGTIGTYSGLLGANLRPAGPALQAWARYTNAHGGVACHPVKVYVADDQASNDRARSAAQDLVENKKAVAFVASFVPNTIAGVQAYVGPRRIPVVGGDGFSEWDSKPMFFNEGGDTGAQVFAAEKFSANLGKKKWAIWYCGESPVCSTGKDVVKQYAAAAGITVVSEEQVSIAQANFTANCLNARNAGAEVIYNINDGSSHYRVADDCASQGYKPLIATSSSVASNAHAKSANLEGMFVASPNAPWMLGTNAALRAYQEALLKYAPSEEPTGTALQTWASAELFKKAIENVGAAARSGPITTPMVLEGLWKVKNETLGGLAPTALNFRKNQPVVPNRCAFIAQIHNGRWSAPIGLQNICR